MAEEILCVLSDTKKLRLRSVEHIGHREIRVLLTHLPGDVHLIAFVRSRIERICTARERFLDHDREVLGALGKLLIHHNFHAKFLGAFFDARRGSSRKRFIQIDHRDLLDAHRPHGVGTRLAESRSCDLRRRHHKFVTLLVDLV